jgi:hypothetical protein
LHKNTYTWQEKHYYALQKTEIEKRGAYNSEIVGSLTYSLRHCTKIHIHGKKNTTIRCKKNAKALFDACISTSIHMG